MGAARQLGPEGERVEVRATKRRAFSIGPAAALVSSAWVAGCASMVAPELDAAHPLTQAHQVTETAVRALERSRQRSSADDDPGVKLISQGLGKVFGSSESKPPPSTLPRPKVTEGAGYRELRLGYREGTMALWDNGLRAACGSQGGSFIDGRFCVSTSNPDEVRFFVLRASNYLEWIEPTASPSAPAYWALVRAAGFVTQAEHASRTRAAQDVRQQEAAAEERRLQREWPLMKEVGVRVCRTEDGIRYMGFVEAFTDTRMRVMVSQATVGNSGYRPGGFQPNVIWTTPHGWSRC